ncbi:Uncharacterised protein [Vibrio cholerae]|nr:Uncharacterised protein [Vibrio cholerae]
MGLPSLAFPTLCLILVCLYQNYLELQVGGKRVNPHEHR